MSTFTRENTEDYTSAELAVLNEAHDKVMQAQRGSGDNWDMCPEDFAAVSKNLCDELHNAWETGSTSDDLIGRLHPSWMGA